jgi:putative hydrolase of the HAD superfamily
MSHRSASAELRAVIFDFFGTVARHGHGATSQYGAVFTAHGHHLDAETEARYLARYDGIEHVEHSRDEETYEAWVRTRLRELAGACEVAPGKVERLVDDLRSLDTGPMRAYDDVEQTLVELRRRGYRLAICSNWGWEIDAHLVQAGLLDLVDVALTSARVGARKPHPRIFSAVLDALDVPPTTALFVGDSLHPDVRGPLDVGMQAVHLWRREDHGSVRPPELPTASRRISTLTELLDWPTLRGAPLEGPSEGSVGRSSSGAPRAPS